MIPPRFRVHPITVQPATGEPHTLVGYAERGADIPVDPGGDDKIPAYTIFVDPDAELAVGDTVTVLGRQASVVRINDRDDGGVTGLAHREATAILVAELAEARAHELALMTAECVVERDTGQTVYDPEQHKNVKVWDQVHTGPCRIQPAGGASSGSAIAQLVGQQINSQTVVGAFPLAVTAPRAGDRLTVTASDDPAQIGHGYQLIAVQASSLPVARRFVATDNQQ